MTLDLSSLRKGVDSLERAVRVASLQIKGKADTDQENVIRAGVIQNFEFTYELCWKFMKRWLENNVGEADVDGVTRKELFRIAAENRLITDVPRWFDYHRARNETAHTYDSDKAEGIYSSAERFLADAKALLKTLESRND